MNHLLAGFACLLFASVIFAYNPRECSKPSDCGPNECCVVGMERYSTPRCESLGQKGSTCVVGNEPEDKVLSYPNGAKEVFGVYRLFCPCAEPLSCSRAKCH
ncbi:hypothetical protein AVEN_252148-1 [Araneus ventricosus]|uniref:Prokineticin domain-containing protein n=1 Tax=Araneus ventricosus TaxID=182803 RepID=A0A4Y2L106_ARAVE|nr:hypothetical protein AVEN_252148-1 [Araneus ventricosus]